jgi:hypothetical protein
MKEKERPKINRKWKEKKVKVNPKRQKLSVKKNCLAPERNLFFFQRGMGYGLEEVHMHSKESWTSTLDT